MFLRVTNGLVRRLDPAHADIRAAMHECLFRWLRTRKLRLQPTDAEIEARGGEVRTRSRGVFRGYWGPEEE